MAEKIAANIIVRKAAAGDVAALESFIQPFVTDGKLLPRTLDELGELLDSFFIAEYDGKIIGCAALEIYNRKLSEIRSLAVDPAMQGAGVGKKLVQACLDLAHERQIFEVMAISSSEAFFKACGFDFTLPGEKKAFFIQTRDHL